MGFFSCVILIAVMYITCKVPEWKANNRTTPSGMKTDWGKMSEDWLIKGMSHRDIYKKQCQEG